MVGTNSQIHVSAGVGEGAEVAESKKRQQVCSVRMKARKYKRSEHFMQAVYEKGFGLRQPYQLLVDATFCNAVVQHKFDLNERLLVVLGGKVRLMVTNCVMAALRQDKSDPKVRAAQGVARAMELRRCRHDTAMPVPQCFADLIDKTNRFHYGVVTNDEELKNLMRGIAGVPIVHLQRVFPLLEPPTKLTLETMARKEASKRTISPVEAKIIEREFGEGKGDSQSSVKVNRRRKAKGPNPLAVRRSSKTKSEPVTRETQGSHPKRKRRSKKRSVVAESSDANKPITAHT
jgi:U3 small nucleolar RNA-associated protein 23